MFGPIETSDGYVMVAIASEKTFQSPMKALVIRVGLTDPAGEYARTAARTGPA